MKVLVGNDADVRNCIRLGKAVLAIPSQHAKVLKDVQIILLHFDAELEARNALSAYCAASKVITVSETIRNARVKSVEYLVMHELGHAFDHVANWRAGLCLDQRDIDDSLGQMSSAEKAASKSLWFTRREMFAELYALAYCPDKSPHYFGLPRDKAEKCWSAPLSQVRAL